MLVADRPPAAEFTWADIADAPDDGLRREIIGGSLIVNPAPFVRHQRVVFRLSVVLDLARPAGFTVLPAPVDWRYDETGVVEPDIVVVSVPLDLDGLIPASVVPDLLVEVLSSNATFDRSVKRELYERSGVAHYWLVDPGRRDREPAIEALALRDGRYERVASVSGSERFAVDAPFPVAFAPSDLLA